MERCIAPWGQYENALQFYQDALAIATEIGDRAGEGATLNNIGVVYRALGQYEDALRFSQDALAIATEIGDRSGEGITLNNIGLAYYHLGQYEDALRFSQGALAIRTEIGDRAGEGATLNNIGLVYRALGQYEDALGFYQDALAILTEIDDRAGEGSTLNNIGAVYRALGQYEDALRFSQDALTIRTEIGDRAGEGGTLNNIGLAYYHLGQYEDALRFYQDALTILTEIDDRAGEGVTLNNIGLAYYHLRQYEDALRFYQDALAIRTEIGDRAGEGVTLNNIGLVYDNLGQYQDALEFSQDALAIRTEIGDRAGEGVTLNNIGYTLEALEQPELAVVFFKQSVSQFEAIRSELGGLSTADQQAFADSVASSYRKLADLLLQDDRILEAQRVLDLLKVQELDESLRSVGGSSDTATGIAFWQIEEDLLALYEQVTSESAEWAALQDQDYDSLTSEQQQRLSELQQRYKTVQDQFIAFLDLPEVQALLEQIDDETDGQNVDIERQHRKLQNRLRDLPQETALLYPLILPDRLELVLVTADGPPLRFPIAVAGADLNRKIVAFGQALKSPGSDIQPLAQELYTLLFAKLETTLDQAGIESIIYAPDGALRYVPLAALHDGENYLADRFSISHIVAASLTDFALPPDQDQRQLLAAACAECSFTITVGDREFPFGDLPYTEAEVTSLAEQMPDTTVLLNQDFSLKELENRLNNYSILHLATHGAVVENAPAQSFVVLGSGEQVSLETIRNSWSLDAELVVLSACETAIGSEELGSGVEILGLGYQIQEAGAQAVLASLWKVSDPGTEALMSAFYEALAQGMTKAEALQAAQRAMIETSGTVGDADDPRAGARPVSRDGAATGGDHPGYSHPYYWAPFILIGNGL
ncbi:MAG: tetratricopeptide repeat protein [Leptolyngbya sp. SIOISBB]|nr:tetratricopeptide repeat protein [Leptolyngbya sp. SIOISBB]